MRYVQSTGFRSGLLFLVIISAAFVTFRHTEAKTVAVQVEIAAPPDKKAMERFMTRKLASAQRALEGVAREDYELIKKTSEEMIELSRQAAWQQMASHRYVQDTTDFVAAAEFLYRMADAKDTEGTSLGFMRLTMTCTNCHNHVRTASVAKLDEEFGPSKISRIASSFGEVDIEAANLVQENESAESISAEPRRNSETR